MHIKKQSRTEHEGLQRAECRLGQTSETHWSLEVEGQLCNPVAAMGTAGPLQKRTGEEAAEGVGGQA